MLPVGHGAIAAPLPEMAGVGSLMPIGGDGRRYIVHSDELMAAFLELERVTGTVEVLSD